MKLSNERWYNTPIIVTPTARRTDPMTNIFGRDNWWKQFDDLFTDKKLDKKSNSGKTRSSKAFDHVCSAYSLRPNQPVEEALETLETRLANRQRDDSQWEYWLSLRCHLSDLPPGALMRDSNPRCVVALISKLQSNLI